MMIWSSANILIERDKVVGIAKYWEYTTAWNVNPYNESWRGEVGKFVQEYPEALKMEEIRQKYFGDF